MDSECCNKYVSILSNEKNPSQERQLRTPVCFAVLAWTWLPRVLMSIRQDCDHGSSPSCIFILEIAADSTCSYSVRKSVEEKQCCLTWSKAYQILPDPQIQKLRPIWDHGSLDTYLDINTTLRSFLGIPLSATRTHGVWTKTKSSCGPY